MTNRTLDYVNLILAIMLIGLLGMLLMYVQGTPDSQLFSAQSVDETSQQQEIIPEQQPTIIYVQEAAEPLNSNCANFSREPTGRCRAGDPERGGCPCSRKDHCSPRGLGICSAGGKAIHAKTCESNSECAGVGLCDTGPNTAPYQECRNIGGSCGSGGTCISASTCSNDSYYECQPSNDVSPPSQPDPEPTPSECTSGEQERCGSGGSDVGVCTISTRLCVAGVWGSCSNAVSPSDEVCDGLDNDCDGYVDESCDCANGETRNCSAGDGICATGTQECANNQRGTCMSQNTPEEEVCDGLDNDCDGQIDEGCECTNGETKSCGTDTGECTVGTQTCTNNTWGTCEGEITGSNEICDEKDNDCDGEIDEGCECTDGEQQSCGNGVGVCAEGTQVCSNGKRGSCTGAKNPSDETCDGLDNDCDGETDEGCECVTGEKSPCGNTTGECTAGYRHCRQGKRSTCEGGQGPTSERCDGLDNDCDAIVDEGVKNACGVCGAAPDELCDGIDNDCDEQIDEGCECLEGETKRCGSDIGVCQYGIQTCDIRGRRGPCRDGIKPSKEVCDDLDNDCDEHIDEGDVCTIVINEECGNGRIAFHQGEECDDGNRTDGDGCDMNCRWECNGNLPVEASPRGSLEDVLRSALYKLRLSCQYHDIAYDEIRFRDVQRSHRNDPVDVLRTYCIVKGYDKDNNERFHKQIHTSTAEYIKVLAKIHAMNTCTSFDEQQQYNGYLHFTDVKDTDWYANYVGYADYHGFLEGIGEMIGPFRILKPHADITVNDADVMLYNSGIKESYLQYMGRGKYLNREDMAQLMVAAHHDVFVDYIYVYGNNIDTLQGVYEALGDLDTAEQKKYILEFIEKLQLLDAEQMGELRLLHVQGMIELLTNILQGRIENGGRGSVLPIDRDPSDPPYLWYLPPDQQ